MSTGLPKILYDNRLADATPVASSTDAGDYNVLNLRDWKPYTWWKPISLPATVTVDCGVAKAADYALIYGHDLVSNHCGVEIRGSTDNFVSSDVLLGFSNLLDYSENFATWWNNDGLAAQGASFNWSRFPLQEWHSTSGKGYIYAPYNFHYYPAKAVLSFYVKKNTSSSARIWLYDNAASIVRDLVVAFDGAGAASFSSSSNIDGYGIESQGDGVYRVWIFVDAAARGIVGNSVVCTVDVSPSGTGYGTYIGGAQLNAGSTPAIYQSTSNNSDRPLFIPFDSASYLYYRLKFRQLSGAARPSVAIAAIGEALEIPRRLKEGFDPIGREPQGQSNRSQAGHPLGRVIDFELWSETLRWKNLNWSWLRNSFVPAYNAHLRGNPFAFAWDPVDHADEVYLVEMKKGFKGPHRQGEYCDLSFDVQGVMQGVIS